MPPEILDNLVQAAAVVPVLLAAVPVRAVESPPSRQLLLRYWQPPGGLVAPLKDCSDTPALSSSVRVRVTRAPCGAERSHTSRY